MFSHPRLRRSVPAALLLLVVACSSTTRDGQVVSPRTNSGNILTAADIEKTRTVNSVEELLLLMPGIIVRRGGSGGSSVQMSGRGGTPLFVVNGIPMPDAGAALGLNPRDVERIELVKDGGATAQYGFRGANGIILITTKH